MTPRWPSRRFIPFSARYRGRSRSHLKEHEPPRDAQRRSEQLTQRFAEFGAAGARFLEGLLASTRYGKNQAERVVADGRLFASGCPRALERAVQYALLTGRDPTHPGAQCQPQTPREALADDYRTYLESLGVNRHRCDPPPSIKPYWARSSRCPSDRLPGASRLPTCRTCRRRRRPTGA